MVLYRSECNEEDVDGSIQLCVGVFEADGDRAGRTAAIVGATAMRMEGQRGAHRAVPGRRGRRVAHPRVARGRGRRGAERSRRLAGAAGGGRRGPGAAGRLGRPSVSQYRLPIDGDTGDPLLDAVPDPSSGCTHTTGPHGTPAGTEPACARCGSAGGAWCGSGGNHQRTEEQGMARVRGPKLKPDTLYYGDCLEVMAAWPEESIDLIYLDPPFNSKQKYSMLFGDAGNGKSAQLMAFEDSWHWGPEAAERVETIRGDLQHPANAAIDGLHRVLGNSGMVSYLSYMALRLEGLHRVLKGTGSLFLHCDPTASHYLKVLMDGVFGANKCRNEIVWCYTGPGSPKMRQFNRKHDIVFWYVKGDTWCFNKEDVRLRYAASTVARGAYDSASPTTGDGLRDVERGKVPESWWSDIPSGGQISRKELVGYPTQKPLALLRRIIKACSNPGETVLDPFCGCGTSVEAAHGLRRKFVGIDLQPFALDLIRKRRLPASLAGKVDAIGLPKDLRSAERLHRDDPFGFEAWAIIQIPGFVPNEGKRQRGDRGIDGRAKLLAETEDGRDLVLAQVKGKATASAMRDFMYVLNRKEKNGKPAACGVFITLRRQGREAQARAAELGTIRIGAREHPRCVLWSMEDFYEKRMPDLPGLKDPRDPKARQGLLPDEDERTGQSQKRRKPQHGVLNLGDDMNLLA